MEKKVKRKMKIKLRKVGITKPFIIGGVSLLVFCLLFFLVNMVILPQIKLTGGKNIKIEYKENYKEKGYKATHFGKNITKNVKVKGTVNTSKLGQYKITYYVKSGALSRKTIRKVEVVDTTKPKLKTNKDDIYVCPGSKYKIEKIKAIDNYDGDITNKVKSNLQKEKVTYEVTDSNGNKRSITKKIFYKDIEKPIITLNGTAEIDMCTNEVYKDPGYSALDNCDNDVTANVQTEGNVDNSLVGDYKITYKVSDKAGNIGEANRTVHVSDGDQDGSVYLTFDDGPNDGTTNVILDILKEEGVQATFFVTNKGPDELIKREYDEGHTVALHTASHDYSVVYASEESYFNDLQQVHDRVYNLTGYDSKFIRFPGGASNTVSRHYSSGIMSRLTQEVLNRGYKYYDWNISSGDAGSTTDPHQVYLNVTTSLRKDRVNMVLMHDIKPYTRDALRDIIRYCKENGYQIKKINNCTTMITQRVNN